MPVTRPSHCAAASAVAWNMRQIDRSPSKRKQADRENLANDGVHLAVYQKVGSRITTRGEPFIREPPFPRGFPCWPHTPIRADSRRSLIGGGSNWLPLHW